MSRRGPGRGACTYGTTGAFFAAVVCFLPGRGDSVGALEVEEDEDPEGEEDASEAESESESELDESLSESDSASELESELDSEEDFWRGFVRGLVEMCLLLTFDTTVDS